ncbi:MAG: methyltransferase domain-containing protein [Phycisphaerales bacterium]|nr:methyltransferase domain-containing protein [Phycisphaerales bacterium]
MFSRRARKDREEPGYLRPYAEVARRVGAQFEALLWQSAEGQRRRFDVLAEMIEPERRSIADLGCGRVDLLVHLHALGRVPRRYVGVDGLRAMVEAGRGVIDAHRYPDAEVHELDFVADAEALTELVQACHIDTLIFSGSLNTLEQPMAEEVLQRAYDVVPPGGLLAFNFLSNLLAGQETGERGPAFRFATLDLVAWALRRTPLVRFRHDYLGGHDATITMTKPA